jgi:negative regulator of genetic competence, sporulation and motility
MMLQINYNKTGIKTLHSNLTIEQHRSRGVLWVQWFQVKKGVSIFILTRTHAGRQAGMQTDRDTHRHTHKYTDRQTDTRTHARPPIQINVSEFNDMSTRRLLLK